MKKVLLVILIFTTWQFVNAQTEFTSYKPLYGHGGIVWYDDSWAALTSFQKGSTWVFAGEYPDAENVDSVYCNISICDNETWQPGPNFIDTAFSKGGTADGNYNNIYLTIPDDWPSVQWQELGSGNYDRPIVQTRIGYDTTIYPFGVPYGGGPGNCYHALVGNVCNAFSDSLHLYPNSYNYTITGYETEAPYGMVELSEEIKKGADSIHIVGYYGIENIEVLTIGLYHVDYVGETLEATTDTIILPGSSTGNSGIFDYYYVINPEFTPSVHNIAADEDLVVKLIAEYAGDETQEIWFNGDFVDCYTPDSIIINDLPKSYYGNGCFHNDTLTATVFPEGACQDVVWTISESPSFTITSEGVVKVPDHYYAKTCFVLTEEAVIYATSVLDTVIDSVDAVVFIVYDCNGLIQSFTELQSVSIHPNPARDYITLSGIDNRNYQVMIYNLLGELIQTNKNNSSNSNELSIEHLNPGNYFLHIYGKQGHKVLRFSKM